MQTEELGRLGLLDASFAFSHYSLLAATGDLEDDGPSLINSLISLHKQPNNQTFSHQ